MLPPTKILIRGCSCFLVIVFLVMSDFCASQDSAAPPATNEWKSSLKEVRRFLTNHCGDCHAEGSGEGGFEIEKLDGDLTDEAGFSRWERVFDRVDAGEMPPADSDRPDSKRLQEFLSALRLGLTDAHRTRKGTVLRRLNRKEYENTLNDLFGVSLKLAERFPDDGRSHEFDNIGSALGISMTHLNRYIDSIQVVLDQAIARTTSQPKVDNIKGSYLNTREGNEFIGKIWKKLDDGSVVRFAGGGYPSGMIRSTGVRYAGHYRVKVTGYAYQSKDPITFSVGGTTFKRGAELPTYGYFAFEPGKPQTIEFTARIEQNYMVIIEPYGIRDPERYQRKSIANYKGPGLAIQSVELTGPLMDQFPTRGHRLLFDGIQRKEIEPGNPRDKLKSWYKPKFAIESDDERKDAARSIKRIAAFAFRRYVTDKDVTPFVELFEAQRKMGRSFEESLRLAVTAIFSSPGFLYFQEEPGKLGGFSLASRLSYFLNRTMPDKELLRLAGQGRLEGATLRQQSERLMKGEKFQRFLVDFCDAWLNLRELDFTVPDSQLFPEYDQYLRYSMPLETYAYLRELIEGNLSIRNLVESEFVMINDRLSHLYGIEGVKGSSIRKVQLKKNSVRGGFLTQASVLKVSANGTNTSPVVRGVWVMERMLSEPPQPPPPGVPGVEPDIRGATTLRQILDKHRDSDNCKACHQRIDPPGFALEAFSPIGLYRKNYRSLGGGEKTDKVVNGRRVRYRIGPAVDCSGQLPDGEKFSNFREFRSALARNERRLAIAFTRKLLTFATGRELGFSDREEVIRIVSESEKSSYRIRDLIHLVIASNIFQSK